MYNIHRFGGSFSNNVITSGSGTGRTRSFSCNQAPYEFGNCGSNLRMWTFVWQTKSCEPFIYSGCGGGGNRYKSECHVNLAQRHFLLNVLGSPVKLIASEPVKYELLILKVTINNLYPINHFSTI